MLDREFNQPRTILAEPEFKGSGAVAVWGYIAANVSDYPLGFPRGLLLVATTIGGKSWGFAPYMEIDLTVEDCEDAWAESTVAWVTQSVTTSPADVKIWNASVSIVCTAAVWTWLIATEVVTKDMSNAEFIVLWLKSSVALDAGDLTFVTDETAKCASPNVAIDIPATPIDTWTMHTIPYTGWHASTISVGINQVVDKGAFTLLLAQVKSFVASSSAATWILKEEIRYWTDTWNDFQNVDWTGAYRVAVFNSWKFVKKELHWYDAWALADLSWSLQENSTVVKI